MPGVTVVALIEYHHAPGGEVPLPRLRRLRVFAQGDRRKRRDQAIVIQSDMQLERRLLAVVIGPGEYLHGQIDQRTIRRKQFVLESEPMATGRAGAAPIQRGEQGLKELSKYGIIKKPRPGSSLVINWLFAFPLQQGLGIQAFFLGAKWDSSGRPPMAKSGFDIDQTRSARRPVPFDHSLCCRKPFDEHQTLCAARDPGLRRRMDVMRAVPATGLKAYRT